MKVTSVFLSWLLCLAEAITSDFSRANLWTWGILPYRFSDDYGNAWQRHLVVQAIRHIEQLTCIKFSEVWGEFFNFE